MIRLENTIRPSSEQWWTIIMGTRNPMNSWHKCDSEIKYENIRDSEGTIELGPNDHDLMMRLANAGPVHGKFRRMIAVYVDITAPLYWWKEFDTYKIGTTANSCSTMHKIHAKKFELSDFSTEHLFDEDSLGVQVYSLDAFRQILESLNVARDAFLETKDNRYWWQMIQLLPSSYNQRRTVMLNYEVLANIYEYRRNHKLDEWHGFCDWIESLPYSEIITGEKEKKNDCT